MNHINSLQNILPNNPIVYLCDGFSKGRAISPYVGALTSAPNLQFYSINPTAGNRSSANVTEYRNFLFESDSLPIETQRLLLPRLAENFPIRMATYSGSKSIHLIVSMADTAPVIAGTDEGLKWYKLAWKAIEAALRKVLFKELENLVGKTAFDKILSSPTFTTFDHATSDPSRLSRTPQVVRDNNALQEMLHIGELISAESISSLISLYKEKRRVPLTKAEPVEYMALESFERILFARQSLHYVKLQFEQARHWQSPAGHYDKLFKLCLWVYDATGVPKETLLTYLQKHTFPIIYNSGYPRDPSRAVHDAYRMKGVF